MDNCCFEGADTECSECGKKWLLTAKDYRWRKYPEEKPEKDGLYICELEDECSIYPMRVVEFKNDIFYFKSAIKRWTFIPEDNEEKG